MKTRDTCWAVVNGRGHVLVSDQLNPRVLALFMTKRDATKAMRQANRKDARAVRVVLRAA